MKTRNPEYDRRDLMFVHACETCARERRCSFRQSPEGPEAVCVRLIEGGTYNCESCVRRMKGPNHTQCSFQCTFHVAKPPVVAVSGQVS